MTAWAPPTVLSLAVTVGIYGAARTAEERHPQIPGLLVASVVLIMLLAWTGASPTAYLDGATWLTWLLGPATISLAVPLYEHRDVLRRHLWPVVAGIVAGAAAGMAAAGALALAFGLPRRLLWTVIAKGATTPIAVAVVRELGGLPGVAAVFTVLTGLVGAIVGPPLLDVLGIRDPVSRGVGVGTAGSGIGTARMLVESPTSGAASSVAMALTGIAIAVFALLVHGRYP